MTSRNPPEKGVAHSFSMFLFSSLSGQIQTSPTIQATDFQVSVDGSAFAPITTVPTESPVSSGRLLVNLSASEMDGDEVVLKWFDVLDDEWDSGALIMHTVAPNHQFDDLAPLSSLNNLSAFDVWNTPGVNRTLSDIYGNVTVISSVNGGEITVYQDDTWRFNISNTGFPPLTTYDNVIFCVKKKAGDLDTESVLYVDSVSGLVYIGKAAPSGSVAGVLTIVSDTELSVDVNMSEVSSKIQDNHSGLYIWWLKVIDDEGGTDVGQTVTTGSFIIKKPGVSSIT